MKKNPLIPPLLVNDKFVTDIKGAEATCVRIATEMKKCFRLKDMLNFNIL